MIIAADRALSPKLPMGNPAPRLRVKTLAGNSWNLSEQSPQNYTMVVFYRGLHCPICIQYLTELQQKLDVFKQLGIEAIAISGDSHDKAQQIQALASLSSLTLGYDLTLDDMHRWSLYMSKGHFEKEPTFFSEPALFLIKPDGRLYLANIGTHPFSRIDFDFLAKGLEYVIAADYPFRGTE